MTCIAEYMTKVPHSIKPNSSVLDAKKRMFELSVTHLPVLSGGKTIGILSERDILYLKALESVDLATVKVGDAMTPDPISVQSDQSLKEACRIMRENKVGSILIMNEQKLAGIFTYNDALEYLANH